MGGHRTNASCGPRGSGPHSPPEVGRGVPVEPVDATLGRIPGEGTSPAEKVSEKVHRIRPESPMVSKTTPTAIPNQHKATVSQYFFIPSS